VAGGAAALAIPTSPRRPAWLWAADAAAALAVVLAVGIAGWTAVAPDLEVAARRAERLLSLPDASPLLLNNAAWRIATADEPEPRLLAVAERLAERAVEATRRRDPNLLDTLAEVHFQAGDTERALRVIDEAIALAPDEPYYREQRRRFLGERAPDDRPAPPEEGAEPERLPLPDAPSIRV
jgi:hypothetical protein